MLTLGSVPKVCRIIRPTTLLSFWCIMPGVVSSPLVTVSEVVRFGLPPGTTILAGAGGLGNPVTWARLLRARPTTLSSVERGEVWLLSPGALFQVGDHRAATRLVQDLASAGIVAMVVSERPIPELLAAANETSLPLVLLPSDTSLMQAEKALVGFLVDRERTIGTRVQTVYDRLLGTLVEDRGSELIGVVLHDVTGKAFYLLDDHFQPTVQMGGDERTAEGLVEIRRRFWEGQLGPVGERLITLLSGEGRGTPRLAALLRPINLRNTVEGYLALLGNRDEFGDFESRVADRAASVLAIELAKQLAVEEAHRRVQGDFLQDLFDNPSVSLENLTPRARGLGYDLASPCVVAAMRLALPQRATPSTAQLQNFMDVARRRLALANVASLLRIRGGTLHILLPAAYTSVDHLDGLTGWIETLRSEIEDGLAPEILPIVAGIGRSPGPTVSFHQSLQEAIQAADISATLPEGARTLHFARLGALRLIFHLVGHPELQAFLSDLLGPLETSDRSGRSEFLQTLDAYFHAGGNHMQAARNLHVHRNTLIYRLDRIQEVLGGVDLEDPDTRLNLQLALKIRAAFGAQPLAY